MDTVKITVDGAEGAPLAARLEMPSTEPAAFAVFAHCFTCGKDSSAAVRVARALAARGIAVLRFDFTGLGHSGGDFADTNFSSNIADLVVAGAYLREHHRPPQILIGHSLGGAAVIAAAHLLPEVRAVVTIGAPSEAGHVAHHFAAHANDIESTGQADVSLGGRTFTVKQQFFDDLSMQNQAERIAGLRRALLVLHSPTDDVVGIENAAEIFQAAKHPKSFVSLDDADHFLTRPEDADYAADLIATWSARYVGVERKETGQGA